MNQKKTFYKVAEVVIAIEGSNDCAEELRKYFEQEELKTSQNAEDFLIQVNMDDDIEDRMDFWSLSKGIGFNESEYWVRKKRFEYSVSDLFDKSKKTILRINWKRKASVLNYVKAHLDPKGIGVYKNSKKFVDSIMNYEVFLYILPFVLMKYNKVFIHSGVVTQENEAIIMAGTGGCGKTSALLEYLNQPGYKYVVDDFGILDCNGCTWFIPKKTAIYQTDAQYGNEHIVRALTKLSFKDKLLWNASRFLGKNPRYRFSPYELFDKVGVCKCSKLKQLVYLARKNTSDFKKSNISRDEVVERVTNSSFRELRELNEILRNIRAVGNENIRAHYPSMEMLEKQYKMILLEALKDAEVALLELPVKAVPSEIVKNINMN